MIFLTGLPCSGKTTLGLILVERLRAAGKEANLLDGDAVRHLWPDLGFSREDREENIRRIAAMAEDLERAGIIAIVSAISPYRSMRNGVRERDEGFIEVYVNAPLSVCEQRDVKGMYFKARHGELDGFTGVGAPYEPPDNPEVECRTDLLSISECVEKILCVIEQRRSKCLNNSFSLSAAKDSSWGESGQ